LTPPPKDFITRVRELPSVMWLTGKARWYAPILWFLPWLVVSFLILDHIIFSGGFLWAKGIPKRVAEYYEREKASGQCSDRIGVTTDLERVAEILKECKRSGPVVKAHHVTTMPSGYQGSHPALTHEMCFDVVRQMGAKSRECWIFDSWGIQATMVRGR
jgi:hypothetical protein